MAIDAYECRLIAASFAASAALHAAVLAIAPLSRHDQSFEPPRVLSVLLAAVAPPKEEVAPVPVPPPPKPAPRVKRLERASPTQPVAPADLPPTALAQPPDPASVGRLEPHVPPPAITGGQPSAAAAPPAAREPSTPPDFRAAYLRNPSPAYPASARRKGEEGTVTLRVLVSTDGLPQKIELERSSGSNALDLAALQSVQQWRFVPARRGGEPREAWVIVPIVFRLEPSS